MSKVMTREDHLRNHRRRGRQALGLLLAVLMLIGAATVLRGGVGLVAQLFDDTEAKQEYQDKLEGLVMFDPLPFEGIENIDDLTLREAAVWGCVYNIQETQGSFESYSHDPETEQLLLPAVEVDSYLAKLVGPSFKLSHQTFEMEDMTVEYDEALQCYRVPVTGGVGWYRATVTSLFKQNGKLHVTVGYIPLANSEDLTVNTSDAPTKYMDYVFERTNGNWYLTGLTESATKPEATPAPEAGDTTVLMPEDLESAIIEGLNGGEDAGSEAVASSEAEQEAGSEDTSDGAEAGAAPSEAE